MPLTIGGRTPGPSDDQKIEMLAECWVDATERAATVQHLESKVDRQSEWLDTNRDDPRYGKRLMQHIVTKDKLRREMNKIHDLASTANRMTDQMDSALKKRAQSDIHAWAGIGGPGIYALAWNLVPSQTWLEDAEAETETLRATVPTPF